MNRIDTGMMNAITFWLLDAAIEYGVPLSVLASDTMSEQLNRSALPCTLALLPGHLEQLVRQDALELFWIDRADEGMAEHHIPREAHREAIQQGLEGDGSIRYAITRDGGHAWEAVAQPQWDRYVSATLGSDPPGSIEAATPTIIETYVALENQMGSGHFQILPTTWEMLTPWRATYWKTLPLGTRVQANYLWPADVGCDTWDAQIYEQLSIFLKWYTNPYEM